MVTRARGAARHRAGGTDGHDRRYVWALRDVSFEIAQGEVVGVIGRNGAGKSTLLKVLSRITEPTEGRAIVRGRVGSLLEVGAGFHQELTGRENIFLSGAVMGMRRAEIKQKFDEIVDFAGVETFLDTPIKRYSSGMFVRLAFAVAAFLEAEVLLIDEVLAVGDAEFQRRCFGKMNTVAREEGRTVLLVSHNMASISQLCPRTLWIDAGRVRRFDETPSTIAAYLREADAGTIGELRFEEDAAKDAQVRAARIIDSAGQLSQRFTCDDSVVLEFESDVRKRVPGLFALLQIWAADGVAVLTSYSYDTVPNPLDGVDTGRHLIRVAIPPRTLAPGDYRIHLSLGRGFRGSSVVDDTGVIGSFSLDDVASIRGNNRPGYFSTLLDWSAASAKAHSAEVA